MDTENGPDLWKEELRQFKPDTIIVLGSGIHTINNELLTRHLKLSLDERIRLSAAVGIYQILSDPSVKIVLCGGEVYKGYPPLSEIARDILISAEDETKIPPESILVANKALNTVAEIEDAKEIMRQNNLKRGVIISNTFHKTADFLAKRHGFKFIPAEIVLPERHSLYRKLVDELKNSDYYINTEAIQKGRIPILKVPVGEQLYKIRSDATLPERAAITKYDREDLQKMVKGKIK